MLVAGLAWWLAHVDTTVVPDTIGPTVEGAGAPLVAASDLPAATPGDEPRRLEADGAAGPALAADAATPGAFVLELRRQADDAPIADAEIRLFANITAADARVPLRATGRTSAEGTWRVEFPQAAEVWLVRALPGPGHALVEADRAVIAIAPGATERLVLRAPAGAVVRGQVVDESERPVPGAAVAAWSEMRWTLENGDEPLPEPHLRAVADGAGRFELGGLGPQLVLMPEAPGLAAVRGVAGPIDEGAVVDGVTLVLGAASELRGRVVDPAGAPVAGVRVRAGHGNLTPTQGGLDPCRPLKVVQTTGEDGRFLLAPLAAGRCTVSVNATEQRFQPWSRSLTPDGTELLIQLSSGLALSGMVLGADGAPLDGAEVRLQGASEDEFGNDTAWAGTAGGRFVLEPLVPATDAVLGVSAAGHALFVREGVVVDEAAAAAPLELRLEPERPIAGRVVDEHDRPLEGAEVSVRGDRRIETGRMDGLAWEHWFFVGETRTDAEGRFRLERLYDGLFELAVLDPRADGLRHTESVRSGVEDLLIRLDAEALRRAVLAGSVFDAASGAPLDAFRISLEPLDEARRLDGTWVPFESFADAQGAFRMEGIEPGRWRLWAWADGYARETSIELELREGEQRVEVPMRPARTLRMRFVDQDRQPVASTFVSFEEADGRRYEPEAQPLGDGTIGMTDKAGELTAHGLPADRLSIVLKLRLVPGAQVGTTKVRVPVDLRVQPEGVQEFTIERRRQRCLVLMFHETDAALGASVYDTEDEAAVAALKPYLKEDVMRLVARPITVTVNDADGRVVDTGRCAANAEVQGAFRVSSSVCDSEGEPASWLALALPAGPSHAAIAAEGYEPVTLDLPAGEGHLKRMVILQPASR